MKIAAINNYNNYNYYNNKVTPIKFRGLWNKTPDLAEKFQYGMEALDDNSVLVVTSDEESSNFMMKRYAENIGIPILNKYTIKVGENDLHNKEKLDANFLVFKKNNEYFVQNLGPMLTLYTIKEALDIRRDSCEVGDIKKLEQGKSIYTGELLLGDDKKDKFVFTPPYRYNPENARKYLDYKSSTKTEEDIKAFNKSAAQVLGASVKKTSKGKQFTFADVGGLDNIIDELRKFVLRPINYPEVFENIRLNKGILLYGPPRCGKTLLGKALANEAGVEYKYMNANEFKTSLHGESENKVRKNFAQLMDKPGILFIDEFDAIGKKRDGSSNARFDDSIVNQLLGSMSDLEKSDTISFVIAATNRKELLDDALTATGRFGLHLEVPLPDEKGLEAIFNVHAKNKPFDSNVFIPNIIKLMKEWEFNGSDVAETITNGYFNALERLGMNRKMDARIFNYNDLKKISISNEDLLNAIKKIAEQKVVR